MTPAIGEPEPAASPYAKMATMPLNLSEGDRFPDVTMLDHDGEPKSISEVAGGRPLFLAFFRGPW